MKMTRRALILTGILFLAPSIGHTQAEKTSIFGRPSAKMDTIGLAKPMFHAVRTGNSKELKSLVGKVIRLDERPYLNTKDQDGRTLLHVAIRKGEHGIASFLVGKGVDVHTRNNLGYTPLHDAVDKDDVTSLKILVDQGGADVDITGPNYIATERWPEMYSPLLAFAAQGATQALKYLVQREASVNARDSLERTALFYAIDSDSPERVRILINSGANVSARDVEGFTPLHMCMKWASRDKNSVKIAKLLLEDGADPLARMTKPPYRSAVTMASMDVGGPMGDRLFELFLRYGKKTEEGPGGPVAGEKRGGDDDSSSKKKSKKGLSGPVVGEKRKK